MDILATED